MAVVFPTYEEYVEFMTNLPIEDGEAFCLSYLPSAIFPKDAIQIYYERSEPVKESQRVTAQLWNFGKELIRALDSGKATMCIETQAIARFCEFGQVHDASPQYEIGFAMRVQALRKLRRVVQIGGVVFFTGPAPYTFRLHPPSGVLIDVTRNVVEQKIQGLWIDESEIFGNFRAEFDRLRAVTSLAGGVPRLLTEMDSAIKELSQGQPYRWSI